MLCEAQRREQLNHVFLTFRGGTSVCHGCNSQKIFKGHFLLMRVFIVNYFENNKVPVNGKFTCATIGSAETGFQFYGVIMKPPIAGQLNGQLPRNLLFPSPFHAFCLFFFGLLFLSLWSQALVNDFRANV